MTFHAGGTPCTVFCHAAAARARYLRLQCTRLMATTRHPRLVRWVFLGGFTPKNSVAIRTARTDGRSRPGDVDKSAVVVVVPWTVLAAATVDNNVTASKPILK